MYPNIQAYDRGVMFDPTGRLYQVEYAREAVRRGATSIGVVAADSVVIVAQKNITEPLVIPSTLQKIFKVDSHIAATYSGIISDGLHVINMMRNKTQTHRMIYDETESVETVTKEVAEELQQATQYGGLRPYGVSLLLGGIDSEKRLFELDPDASFLGYKATAIGAGKKTAVEMLMKTYKDNMPTDDAIKLCVAIIKKLGEGKLNRDDLEISTIKEDEGYEMLSAEQVARYL